jgi:subtilisin family serine protease
MADVDFSLVSWERGQVLVRFADQLSPSLNNAKSQTKITQVDQILADYQGVQLEQLFPVQKPIPGGDKGFTTYMGVYYDYPKLTNIYKISIKDTSNGAIFLLITALEGLGEEYVLYAEPNYIHQSTNSSPLTNDSLLSQQWAFGATKSDSIRREFQANSKSDAAIVIAILDSGVDTLHLDLRNKIHKTNYEINGLPGVDDDGNGFVDDFWGWDFVNGDNQPLDNLGHGTHCASIAAAENNNSAGIAGIAQDAKIRSYQVLESNNGGTSSNIAQAVSLAAMSGSDIISMSLGGYGRSLALENALQYAYGFSFLVASAGNDGICIRADGQVCPDGTPPSPSYPAAYSFVMGVQATKNWNYMGYRVGWSNYDLTGPYWSDYTDKLN